MSNSKPNRNPSIDDAFANPKAGRAVDEAPRAQGDFALSDGAMRYRDAVGNDEVASKALDAAFENPKSGKQIDAATADRSYFGGLSVSALSDMGSSEYPQPLKSRRTGYSIGLVIFVALLGLLAFLGVSAMGLLV